MVQYLTVALKKISTQGRLEINMKTRTKYIVIKILTVLVASMIMLIVTMFNMLSKEQIESLLKDDAFNFYFSKFKISFSIGILFFFISLIINWTFKKDIQLEKVKIKMTIIELAYYVLFSILTTMLFIKSIS